MDYPSVEEPSFFKVSFKLQVKRISFTFDFDMPSNGYIKRTAYTHSDCTNNRDCGLHGGYALFQAEVIASPMTESDFAQRG